MSSEVDWVLDTIEANWAPLHSSGVYGAGLYGEGVYTATTGDFDDVALELVDRDNSELLGKGNREDIRQRKQELQRSNYVEATYADHSNTPLGFEYDHEVEAVVGVRIVGLHADEWGYVDPDADWPPTSDEDPVPFDRLVHEVRRSILRSRTYPETSTPHTDHYTALITNEAPDSGTHRDFFRYDIDVVLQGDETLP